MRRMKVLVTGASGRLARFVVRELEEAGHELVLTSRTRPAAADRWPWVEGDINDYADCVRAVGNGVEAIQHLAAMPYPSDHPDIQVHGQGSAAPFEATMRTNIMGTYYLLHAAREAGVRSFVMTGSICATGIGFRVSEREFPIAYLPVDEAHPTEVEDSYAFSKLAAEELLASYTRGYGIRTYVLRAMGIFGPERRAETARRAAPAPAWDPWFWSWVGSEDVASAHRLLMEKAEMLPPHDVFFCGADDTTALEPTKELVERFKPELLPYCGDLSGHASLLSNRRLREAVGWRHRSSWRKSASESCCGAQPPSEPR